MSVNCCIPVVPSTDLVKSLRFWVDGLGFKPDTEMREGGRLVYCMLRKDGMSFMLNQRAGRTRKPEDFEGVRFYWAPQNLAALQSHLKALGFDASEIEDRYYGQSEFFVTDDDGFSHCFGLPTPSDA